MYIHIYMYRLSTNIYVQYVVAFNGVESKAAFTRIHIAMRIAKPDTLICIGCTLANRGSVHTD